MISGAECSLPEVAMEMLARAPLVRMLVASRPSLWTALICLAAGCSHPSSLYPQWLAERILPPPVVLAAAAPEPAVPPPQNATAAGHNPADDERAAEQTPPGPNSPSQGI